MFSRNPYEMTVTSYNGHGSEIIFRRDIGAGRCVSLVVMVLSFVFVSVDSVWKLQNMFTMSLILAVICIIFTLTRIHSESLIILASIGVTFKQTSLITSKTRFFDITSIRDIVILEAITKQSVIFQLVLLPSERSCDKKQQIYPLFMSFQPKLEELRTVYKHVQEKLIIPDKGDSGT